MKIISFKKIVIIFLAVLAAVSLLQGCRNAIEYSQDFQYDAAKVLMLGINPYDESLSPSGVLDSLGLNEYFKQMEANQFPSLLFLLLPYTFLEPLIARYLWLASNLIFTALILLLLRKTFFKDYDITDYIIVSLLMISGTPWRNQIGVGQHTLFSLMFFLLAVWFGEKRPAKNDSLNVLLSGLSLCISYFKYTLTVPLGLYFIYKRKWRELIISVIPHILLTIVSAVMLHDSVINMILKPLKVANALTSEGSMDIGSMLGGGFFTMAITVILLIGLLVIVVLVKDGHDKEIISLLCMWSLIITYHRIYDHFVLIIPLCAFCGFDLIKNFKNNIEFIMLIILIASDFYIMRIVSSTGEVALFVVLIYYAYTLYLTARTVAMIKRS